MMARTNRMLTVWWAHWPVVAAGLAAGTAAESPAIVLRANRVVACSPAASAAGVAVGQRRRVAQQRCSAAVLLDHDPDRDARMFDTVLRAVGQFTPRLEMVEPGWLCVESRGPSRYFGGDERLGERIVAAIAESVDHPLDGLGIGIADGRFASAVAARLAVASPVRTMVVAPGASPAFLAPEPVAWLAETGEADGELISLFARLGLSTLGTLAGLPRTDVADRFGPPGEHAHRLAAADDDRPSRAEEPPAVRQVEQVFDDPVMQLQPLVFVGKQLADELTAELAAVGLVCTRLAITAETEHVERSERVWYRAGGLSAAAIVDRIRWQLDGWTTQPGALTAGVVVLRLDPDELRPAGGDQLRLWGGLSAADERAQRAVTRLTGIAGDAAVLVPVWSGGRLPADRYQWVPATLAQSVEGDQLRVEQQHPWPGSLPAPSPAFVFADAEPAVVADEQGRPVSVGGRGGLSASPATLAIGSRQPQPITGWAGPWPLDERWWDEHRHRRLARFQVVTADGAAHLLAVERGQWRLLATYG